MHPGVLWIHCSNLFYIRSLWLWSLQAAIMSFLFRAGLVVFNVRQLFMAAATISYQLDSNMFSTSKCISMIDIHLYFKPRNLNACKSYFTLKTLFQPIPFGMTFRCPVIVPWWPMSCLHSCGFPRSKNHLEASPMSKYELKFMSPGSILEDFGKKWLWPCCH